MRVTEVEEAENVAAPAPGASQGPNERVMKGLGGDRGLVVVPPAAAAASAAVPACVVLEGECGATSSTI